MELLHLHLCSPFLWVYGCPPGSSCLWSRWMPPTSWSGLEDAGGPEEEEGDEEGRESERRRRERDAGVSTCRDWSSAGPHGNRAEADAASGWAWRYLRFTHTHTPPSQLPFHQERRWKVETGDANPNLSESQRSSEHSDLSQYRFTAELWRSRSHLPAAF